MCFTLGGSTNPPIQKPPRNRISKFHPPVAVPPARPTGAPTPTDPPLPPWPSHWNSPSPPSHHTSNSNPNPHNLTQEYSHYGFPIYPRDSPNGMGGWTMPSHPQGISGRGQYQMAGPPYGDINASPDRSGTGPRKTPTSVWGAMKEGRKLGKERRKKGYGDSGGGGGGGGGGDGGC